MKLNQFVLSFFFVNLYGFAFAMESGQGSPTSVDAQWVSGPYSKDDFEHKYSAFVYFSANLKNSNLNKSRCCVVLSCSQNQNDHDVKLGEIKGSKLKSEHRELYNFIIPCSDLSCKFKPSVSSSK
ncbi:hypothetical protein KBC04_03045 [Candidatus Babeliales bacterium]|nr:hypothetical protein [Candidatus Babeliales bacterium]MBP9843971.1 hypothetical protein [Candidatus Babeliales bacterium]